MTGTGLVVQSATWRAFVLKPGGLSRGSGHQAFFQALSRGSSSFTDCGSVDRI
ncbi:hypothetical protein BSU04_46250 [Caballeronia sordidicola]|uniref:Uncharacterized protein n=1 Tax=Caballeronia sordidicola TaxID=196367 RepID=A0A226WK86_CABSO|nr:hypothetical protein BSU04_46250 [Caballeronia sordidicola]